MIKILALHVTESLMVCGFHICFFSISHKNTVHKCRQTVLLYVLQTVTDTYANINKGADRQTYTHTDLILLRGSSHRNHTEQMNNIKPTKNTDNSSKVKLLWLKKTHFFRLSPFAALTNRSYISVTRHVKPYTWVVLFSFWEKMLTKVWLMAPAINHILVDP